MELYQLRTFLAVADAQHLTRAAKRLHISQPSVSAHIKALEEELGVMLFIRTPKGMRMSRAGEALRSRTIHAVQAVDEIARHAARLQQEVSGRVKIGLNLDASYMKAPVLLKKVRRDFPKLEPHFCQRHSLEAFREVRRGDLDAAYTFDPPAHSDVTAMPLAAIEIVLVAPRAWEGAVTDASPAAIFDLPWIWTDDRCPFNRIARRYFEPMDGQPKNRVVVDRDTTIRSMVAAGVGMGLMIAPEARDAAEKGELVIVSAPVARLGLTLISLRQRGRDPVIEAIHRAVSEVWRPVQCSSREDTEPLTTLMAAWEDDCVTAPPAINS